MTPHSMPCYLEALSLQELNRESIAPPCLPSSSPNQVLDLIIFFSGFSPMVFWLLSSASSTVPSTHSTSPAPPPPPLTVKRIRKVEGGTGDGHSARDRRSGPGSFTLIQQPSKLVSPSSLTSYLSPSLARRRCWGSFLGQPRSRGYSLA